MNKFRISPRNLLALLLLPLLLLSGLSFTACTGEDNTTPEASSENAALSSDAPTGTEEETDPTPSALTLVKDSATEYQIVRSDNASSALVSAAVSLSSAILDRTGVHIAPVSDWESERIPSAPKARDCEIILGTTTRQGKYFTYETPELGSYDYIITVVEKRILILGGSESAVVDGVQYFIESYLPAEKTDTIEIDPAIEYLRVVEKKKGITVMSQNLLATDTEYADFANNSHHLVAVRQPRIREIFLKHLPDSIGLQECSAVWRKYFDELDASWSYDRIGANKNEKVSILYNTDTLKLIRSGSIWLTESPETLKISVKWNATTERLAHYAVFEVIATGEHYIHVNTHIGFDNTTVALEQAKVVRDYCISLHEQFGYPVVCTGDFNFDLNSNYYKAFVDGLMDDTRSLAAEKIGSCVGSFNKMGTEGYPKSYPIDQIMVSENEWYVYTYEVDYSTPDGWYYSDHYGVVATLQLKPKE